jgi:glycerol-3-phosphate acyltransferase PlsY
MTDIQPWLAVAMLAGGAAFFGHLFPVWLGFKGGKGVATSAGVILAVAWPVGLAAALTWIVVLYLSRISSLSALATAALAPLFALGFQRPLPAVVLCAVMAVLVFVRHHENIRRLLSGTEPRIGAKKAAGA